VRRVGGAIPDVSVTASPSILYHFRLIGESMVIPVKEAARTAFKGLRGLRRGTFTRIGSGRSSGASRAGSDMTSEDANPSPATSGEAEVEEAYEPGPPVIDPIVLVHVPRCAGGAFAHYLKKNCGAPGRAKLGFGGDSSVCAGVSDAPVIAGPVPFAKMAELFPEGRFVTLLRHPVERVISQYQAWRDPSELRPERVATMSPERFRVLCAVQKMTLEEFVFARDEEIVRNIRNATTGALSCEHPKSHRFLESAKENLIRRFWYFGLVEQFEASMRLFRHSLGWRVGFEKSAAHVHRSLARGGAPSLRAMERLMELNQIDLELYRFAKLLFEDRMRWLDAEEGGGCPEK